MYIIPVHLFNYHEISDPDFKLCWDIRNIQPLWAKENCKKAKSIANKYIRKLNIKYLNDIKKKSIDDGLISLAKSILETNFTKSYCTNYQYRKALKQRKYTVIFKINYETSRKIKIISKKSLSYEQFIKKSNKILF